MTSAMKETMLAVSRTVSPWAIWHFFSSSTCYLKTQQVAGGGEGEAGAGGVVTEDGDAEAGIEDLGGLVALAQVAQGVGHGEDGVQLLVGLVPGPVEVGLVHVIDVQRLQVAWPVQQSCS